MFEYMHQQNQIMRRLRRQIEQIAEFNVRSTLLARKLLKAFAPTGELFGTDGLKQLIINHASATPSELLNAILTAVQFFADNRPLQDDLTLLVASPWSDVRTNP